MWSLPSLFQGRHMLPPAIGQEPMFTARDEFGSIVKHDAVCRFGRWPLVEHMGDAVSAVSTNKFGSIDGIPDAHVG
jgi:hypothetical protein